MIPSTGFQVFPKMGRMFRDMVITEKLDGTNAQILIVPSKDCPYDPCNPPVHCEDQMDPKAVNLYAGSRSRWLQPGKSTDNYGFAQWVKDNAEELKKLGLGRHFGEWWGAGIQRRYGKTEKIFSLFNSGRWHPNAFGGVSEEIDGVWKPGPKCCRVVPVLYRGEFSTQKVLEVCYDLRLKGSLAAPGFMDAEGIITYHEASKTSFKTTLKDDEKAKSAVTTN